MAETKVVNGKTYYKIGDTWGTANRPAPTPATPPPASNGVVGAGAVGTLTGLAGGTGTKSINKPVDTPANTTNYISAPSGTNPLDYLKSGQLLKDTGKSSFSGTILPDGRIMDTSNMTPQQAYAAQLAEEVKSGKRSSSDVNAILLGMGLDDKGNAMPGNASVAFSNKPSSNPTGVTPGTVNGFGGYTYGTDVKYDKKMDELVKLWNSNPEMKQAEIQRSLQVLANQQASGADTSATMKHLTQTLGYNFNQAGAGGGQSGGGTPDFMADLKNSMDSALASQNAQIEKARLDALAALEKAMNDAISQGIMSVNEANAAYAKQAESINQQAYLDSQETNLAATQRGIGNSQQLLGMTASDNANNQALKNQNLSERDTKILNIQERIRSLTNQKNLDAASINNQAAQDRIKAGADLNAQYFDKAFQVGLSDHVANRDFQMDLTKMSVNQKYVLDQMAKQQGYDLEKMTEAQKNDLVKMAKGQEYTLAQMAKQQNYDMAKIAQQFRNQSALNDQEYANRVKLLEQEAKSAEDNYQVALEREAKKWGIDLSKPSSYPAEFLINQAMLKQQSDQQKTEALNKFTVDTIVTNTLKNPYFDPNFDAEAEKPEKGWDWGRIWDSIAYNNPGGESNFSVLMQGLGLKTNSEDQKEYEKKKNAYQSYLDILNGKAFLGQ